MTGRPPDTRLTAREREIASLIGRGLTNKEIAQRLKISQRTADTHVQNMLNKLGASNRAQIVALAGETQAPAQTVEALAPVPVPTVSHRRINFAPMAALLAGAVMTTLVLSSDGQSGLVTTSATEPPQGTSERAIVDHFTSDDVDTSIWDVGAGPHLAVIERGGHLEMYVGADAGVSGPFQVGVNTACMAHGDFDAQVSYELVTWPNQDALSVSVFGNGTPFNVYRTSRERQDLYGVYFPPAGREVRATGNNGALRVTRSGSKWSGYYLISGRWSWIGSGNGPIEDMAIALLVFNGDVAAFGGKEALVYFRDFRLAAARIACP